VEGDYVRVIHIHGTLSLIVRELIVKPKSLESRLFKRPGK